MRYDVIIVGAGPGGIYSAYELMKKCSDKKIAVFDSGYSLKKPFRNTSVPHHKLLP